MIVTVTNKYECTLLYDTNTTLLWKPITNPVVYNVVANKKKLKLGLSFIPTVVVNSIYPAEFPLCWLTLRRFASRGQSSQRKLIVRESGSSIETYF